MEPDEEKFLEDNASPPEEEINTISVPEGTPVTSTNEVDWNSLPGEIACQILEHFNDYAEITRIAAVNTNFRLLLPDCVHKLTSNDTIIIPLRQLKGYRALRETRNIILRIYDAMDVMAIESMLNLKKATFLFPIGDNGRNMFRQFLLHWALPMKLGPNEKYQIIRDFLSWDKFTFGFSDSNELPLESAFTIGKYFNIGQLVIPTKMHIDSTVYKILPLINERIIKYGKNKIFLVNLNANVELKNFGGFEINSYDPRTRLANKPFYLRHQMKSFLQRADFGLKDPLLPPTTKISPGHPILEYNIPLKYHLHKIINGIGNLQILRHLLLIYVYYIKMNYNHNDRQQIFLDNLMQMQFKPLLEARNVKRQSEGKSTFDLNNLPITAITSVIFGSEIRDVTMMDFQDLLTLDQLINIGPMGDIVVALGKVRGYTQTAFNNYRLARQQRLPYYLTDGTRVDPDGTFHSPDESQEE